jgi:hypothetical protein
VADVLASNRHERTGFNITLRVYMKGYPSGRAAAILLAIFIIREMAKDNGF